MARWLLACLVIAMVPAFGHAQTRGKRLNVVFVFTDDQRADTIAALGNKHIKTPNLDKLVARGTTFTRAYCMGANQGAVCVPSRAMVLSGRTLFKINADLKGIPTWPAAFARAGYRTFMTGKWHNMAPSLLATFSAGKSVFLGGMGDPYTLPIADITDKHTLTEKQKSGKHSCELFTDRMVDFIKEQKGTQQPFVAYVAFNGPHDPRTAPKEYHAPYAKNKPPLPPNFLPLHPFNNGDMVGRDEQLAPWPRTPEIVRSHLADYYAYITFLDAQVGRIITALREAGLEEDTIIVFASDHGLAIGSHGLFGKQNLYDHSMHVPLIFAGPGIPQGKQSDAFCYLLDIYPTLGDMAKVDAPKGSDGKSLVPILKGEKTQVRDSIFTAYRQFQRAVRDDRWHMIVYPHINKTQLFDLQNDPHETKDLAADPAQAKTIERLTERLKAWQTESGDMQPLRSEKPMRPEFEIPKKLPGKEKKKSAAPAAKTTGTADMSSEDCNQLRPGTPLTAAGGWVISGMSIGSSLFSPVMIRAVSLECTPPYQPSSRSLSSSLRSPSFLSGGQCKTI
ncbi:MAG TPA: sulfatase-like hydrolase/transferase [Gemmataceae bacterium]|nr:sulfatase-like hydrolase/transferase [Gemmataceae bacterium]